MIIKKSIEIDVMVNETYAMSEYNNEQFNIVLAKMIIRTYEANSVEFKETIIA